VELLIIVGVLVLCYFASCPHLVTLAPHRKRLLLGFGLLGAFSATLFLLLPSDSPLWILSAPLSIFANVGFGASIVAMNAYLPSLARESKEVQEIAAQIEALQTSSGPSEELAEVPSDQSDSPLLPNSLTEDIKSLKQSYNAELSRQTSRISSLGIASGYGAGIFLLIVALVPVTLLHGTTFALRLAIGISGIWWALFSLPAALWLPSIENPQSSIFGDSEADGLSEDTVRPGRTRQWKTSKEIVAAWKRLGNMLRWREVKRLRNTFKYLAAWFLLSDGKFPTP
jgi:MFS transporter, UMF1 family